MSMKQIRDRYDVPAYRGQRIRYYGDNPNTFREAVITSANGYRLRARCNDGLKLYLSPSWGIEYLDGRGLCIDDRTPFIPDRSPDGEFVSYADWANTATQKIGGMKAKCFDTLGRSCSTGRTFHTAELEETFPVRFWIPEGLTQ